MLRVRLFGGLRAESITAKEIGSRKARTLLAALAVARNRPVPIDHLVAVVWDERPPASPVDQLGVLVSRLRRALGSERIRRDACSYRLVVDWSDLAEFDERAAEAEARLVRGAAGAALASAQAALQLAEEPLLGDESGEWAETERRAVTRQLAQLRLVASEAALAVGQPLAAAAAAEAALDNEPYDEAALRLLMRAHTAAGRSAAALGVYARVRQRLQDELGVDPAPETTALHTRILRDEGGATHARQPDDPVGRAAELVTLDELLDQAAAGATRTVVVEGDPGIGKSALLHAFVARARSRATVLVGTCDPLGHDLPLQPLLDGLDGYLRSVGTEEADRVLGEDAAIIGPLLTAAPAVATTQVPVPVDAEEARARLFTALLRVTERMRRDGPTVVVVDDLHVAGTGTIEWLRFAERRAERLLLLLAQRPAPLMAPDGAERMQLRPLDLAAAETLVGSERAAALWERSGGNPLLLLALAAGAEEDDLPDTVHEAVDRVLTGIGSAETTLRTAAVIGRDLDLDLLAGVQGRPMADILDDLDAGIRVRLITESAAGLAFTHELVREALASRVTASRRAFLHGQAANVLRQRSGRDPMTTAWHAEQAGDTALASAELVHAAAVAGRRDDLAVAETLLHDAIALDPTPTAYLELVRVLLRRGALAEAATAAAAAIDQGGGAAAYELAGWAAYYRRDRQSALRFAELGADRADDPATAATCRALAGRIHHSAGELEAARQQFELSVDAAPAGADGVPRVWLAGQRVHQGQPRSGLDLAESALVEPTTIWHPFAVGHGHFARWYAYGMLGRPATGLAWLETFETSSDTRQLAEGRFAALTSNMRAWLLRGVGALDAAAEANQAAIDLATFPGLSEPVVHARLDLVDGALLAADLTAAEARLAEVPSPSDANMQWTLDERRCLLEARLALAYGDHARVVDLATRAVEQAGPRDSRRHELLGRLLASCARARAGEPEDPDAVFGLVAGLREIAGLEAWRWTALAADTFGIDAWHRLVDEQVAAVAREAGDRAETFLAFARGWLAGPIQC